ncbi:MAG: transposase, partial [Methylococcaceae bacterium]|nr:transposase [Methylococcaceae bacterium]
LLSRAGFNKRSGTPIHEVIYGLMLWIWLKKDSIGMFAREGLQGAMGKDVFYDTINREDLNWRHLHRQTAAKTLQTFKAPGKKAFVVDDTIAGRFGKKMPGISSHFDHTSGRHLMGQQVLALGLSCEEGFVPLDSELFISQTKAIALSEPFKDGRSPTAKRYQTAQQHTKPEMVEAMVKRALNAGIVADYLLADAWFGTKAIIRLSQETALVPVLRMKKNKMKYRMSEIVRGQVVRREWDAQSLYKRCVRKAWQSIHGQKYQAKAVDVELNLAEAKDPEQWVKGRLLFVRGIACDTQQTVGKHDWAVFLTTDTALSGTQILELYAMRWAIEVYFKEAKQHLGFLKEQSNHYAAYIASIHLTAIRFCLLVIAKQTQGAVSVAETRQAICSNSTDISFAGKLWQVFRAVITGALEGLKAVMGEAVDILMATIDAHIECWFLQVLQLDAKTLKLEALEIRDERLLCG